MVKVSLHRVGMPEVFMHRVGNGSILAPFRPYAKKPLGFLSWAKYLNKKTPDLMQKTFAGMALSGRPSGVFYKSSYCICVRASI